jgi:hypothetical protein
MLNLSGYTGFATAKTECASRGGRDGAFFDDLSQYSHGERPAWITAFLEAYSEQLRSKEAVNQRLTLKKNSPFVDRFLTGF